MAFSKGNQMTKNFTAYGSIKYRFIFNGDLIMMSLRVGDEVHPKNRIHITKIPGLSISQETPPKGSHRRGIECGTLEYKNILDYFLSYVVDEKHYRIIMEFDFITGH